MIEAIPQDPRATQAAKAIHSSVNTYLFGRRRINRLIAVMSRMTGHTHSEITGDDRDRDLFLARAAVAYACRRAGMSYSQIGQYIGKRDHSTIRSAEKRAKELMASHPCFASVCRILEGVR